MSRAHTKEKKEEKGWKTKTVGEWKVSSSVVWRAQLSVSPDGKRFKGIRKYVITANGTELVTKAGLSIQMTDDTDDELEALSELILTLLKKNKGEREDD